MNKAILGSLSERHLLLFGAIVQLFAQYELLMQEVMTKVSGADRAAIMLLTRRLDFGEKRRALLDLLYHWTVPVDQYDRLSAFLLVPENLSQLRHDIAHAAWIADQSSSWIQPDWILRIPPSVKPLYPDPRAGSERFIERTDDKMTYTLQGLEDIVNSLASNYELLVEYLGQIDLIHKDARPAAAAAAAQDR
ncbi:MAG TPA: hypothetical protein VGG01_08180 [Xanthobacteraceae bacterium]|jgi:hypothetical protein